MAEIFHIASRQALNKTRTEFMGFDWSANPYRGCSHACHYCYARDTHRYLNLSIGPDFSKKLFVKDNFHLRLRQNLCHVPIDNIITLGTATDPYQPIEAKYRITRSILEVFLDTGHALTITTKSPLILRDLDLLQVLARRGQLQVHVSLISLNPIHLRILEPGTSHPLRRVETMAQLIETGVPTAWFLAPILPAITDNDNDLDSIFMTAQSIKVRWLMASIAHFTPSTYTYFCQTLAHSPLASRLSVFSRAYHPSNYTVKSSYRSQLRHKLQQLYLKYGVAASAEGPHGYRAIYQDQFAFGRHSVPNTAQTLDSKPPVANPVSG
ncbi:SPL family radical SAM protein [Sulfobacillus thermosulfidooxidans]|uniref:SPL family radical SAM protein n=1 Tax=Sulfobacillus thermosulfidooxidans TaxID=28034 RepID=UPI0006B56D0C|nr:radical SAM protein [Sulfobacillus thermosulfidooxidans]